MSHQTPLDAPPPPVAPRPPPVPIKAVLIGNASTGKTALRNRFVSAAFSEAYRATIGCDFRSKVVQVGEQEVCFNAWDTAGQERFRSLAPAFYRASDACILVYSLADPSPPAAIAKSIKTWYTDFREKCPVGTGGLAAGDDPSSGGHEDDNDEEEQVRRFAWVCVGTKADAADPARAEEISAAVENALEELLPRRTGSASTAAARRAREARQRKAPTVSVEVLHTPPDRARGKESEGSANKIRKARRTAPAPGQAAAPTIKQVPNGIATSDEGHPVAESQGGSSVASTVTSTATTPTFELDEPIPDLLVATSPPTAPLHFGTAGAPPAVWRGGPFGQEGHVLEADGADLERDLGASASAEAGAVDGQAEEEGHHEDESEAYRFADEGIKHFRRTSAKTGEGIDEVFDYIARRVLAARAFEGLTDEDEHAGTPYRRQRAPGQSVKPEEIIRVNEEDPRSFGKKVRTACCS